jgi:predicted transcriptional regulator
VELRLPHALQTRLTRLAAHRGSDPETLAREAVERLVEHDEWFAGEVEKGLASIEWGATLSHEEVGVRLEALLEKRSRSLTLTAIDN